MSQILNSRHKQAGCFHPVMQWRHHSAHEQGRKQIFGLLFDNFLNITAHFKTNYDNANGFYGVKGSWWAIYLKKYKPLPIIFNKLHHASKQTKREILKILQLNLSTFQEVLNHFYAPLSFLRTFNGIEFESVNVKHI